MASKQKINRKATPNDWSKTVRTLIIVIGVVLIVPTVLAIIAFLVALNTGFNFTQLPGWKEISSSEVIEEAHSAIKLITGIL